MDRGQHLAEASAYEWTTENYDAYMTVTRKNYLQTSYQEVLRRLRTLSGAEPATLFDVGAGDGTFLEAARDHGFEPAGNEIAPGAVALAKERTGIELLYGDLSEIEDPGTYDVVTLWCVLAHVDDHDELLRQAERILRPGGTLFLQTPRWSGMDTVAVGVHDLTHGRVARLVDRRVATHHMLLHSEQSITRTLRRTGFEVLEVRPRVRFSLTTDQYLSSLGVPPRPRKALSRPLDRAIDRGWFFRNVLDAYARKPRD